MSINAGGHSTQKQLKDKKKSFKMKKKAILTFFLMAIMAFNAFGQTERDYIDSGRHALITGDYDKAIADYTQAIRINPNNYVTYDDRGTAYYYKKDYDKAIADYTQVIRISPNFAIAYMRRGDAYLDKKDYSKAISDYESVIKINPKKGSIDYVEYAKSHIILASDFLIVANVRLFGNDEINIKQLRAEIERMEKSLKRKSNGNERRNVLDIMINERLVLQAAKRDKFTIPDNEVQWYIDQLKNVLAQQLGRKPSDAEFTQAIKDETNMELAQFTEYVRNSNIVKGYVVSKKSYDFVIEPTDSDILSYYNANKTQFTRQETVHISIIQVPYGSSTTEKTKAKELADSLKSEIGSNASKFDDVAKRAQTANSGFKAGDAGYLQRDAQNITIVGQTFFDTAFSLKQGEVSKVIEGINGYQIIKITEKYPSYIYELGDTIPGKYITLKDYIKNNLLQERKNEAHARATKELVDELRKGNPFSIDEKNLQLVMNE